MDLNTYLTLDATALAELVNKKEVSPKELRELSFRQLEKVNPSLNLTAHTRKEKALAEAENIKEDSPFAGVPILLKDISQSLKGERLTSGSKLLKDVISDHDSNLVKKIREAGFVVGGAYNHT